MTRSLCEVFPHVRLFGGVEGYGTHFLASMEPIERRSAAELAARLPERARQDLLEWNPTADPAAYLDIVVSREYPVDKVLPADPSIRITDDRPVQRVFPVTRQATVVHEERVSAGDRTGPSNH